MKTVIERIDEIVKSHGDMNVDSVEKLIYLAYCIGAERAAKRVSDKYNKHMHEQNKRANNCRYYKMANKILQNGYIYDEDYAGDITETFGYDETNI